MAKKQKTETGKTYVGNAPAKGEGQAEFERFKEGQRTEELHPVTERQAYTESETVMSPRAQETRDDGRKTNAEKAVRTAQTLRRVLAVVAVVAVVAVATPEFVPILATTSPEIQMAYIYTEEDYIFYEIQVGNYMDGDELCVSVYNDFIRKEQKASEPFISGSVDGLKPELRYHIEISCAGRVLLRRVITAGSGETIEIYEKSSEP
ncbi:MAG: hypothetical protein IJR83_05900 [Clostridia bacterium]|nr:hypothetical protein [Clostridia bacterium]